MTPKAMLLILGAYCCAFAIFTTRFCGAQTTVRPYQFGFTIEEQQHRYEKRDERGIVMGEFGFITADGIYHVTVYATDEEGRFRILAMRNYPYKSPPKMIDMEIVRKSTTTTRKPIAIATTEATSATTKNRPANNFLQTACSSCFLPNKKNKKTPIDGGKKLKAEIRPLSKSLGTKNPAAPANAIAVIPQSKVPKMIKEMAKIATNTIIIKPTPKRTSSNAREPRVGKNSGPTTYPTYTDENMLNTQKTTPSPSTDYTTKTAARPLSSKTDSSVQPMLPSTIPKTGSAGQTGQDGAGDLYRFKYILDYNGHSETGSRNGNKQGNFYAIGDDNVERTVEYVANEFGFQPKIRWRKLPPNEIQSKENTLKEYEFVWFNQP